MKKITLEDVSQEDFDAAAETVVSAISQTETPPAEKPDILERIG